MQPSFWSDRHWNTLKTQKNYSRIVVNTPTNTFATALFNFSIVSFHVKIPLGQHFQPFVFSTQNCTGWWSLSRFRRILGTPQKSMSVRYGRNNATINQRTGLAAHRSSIGRNRRCHFSFLSIKTNLLHSYTYCSWETQVRGIVSIRSQFVDICFHITLPFAYFHRFNGISNWPNWLVVSLIAAVFSFSINFSLLSGRDSFDTSRQ